MISTLFLDLDDPLLTLPGSPFHPSEHQVEQHHHYKQNSYPFVCRTEISKLIPTNGAFLAFSRHFHSAGRAFFLFHLLQLSILDPFWCLIP